MFLYLVAMWHAASHAIITDSTALSDVDQYAFYAFCGLFGFIQLFFALIVILSVGFSFQRVIM